MTDLPDEETTPVRRTRSRGAAPSAAPGAAPSREPDGDAVTADTVPAETELDDTAPRRRATYVDGDGDEPTDGSTIIARRESRRRAAREHEATGSAPAASVHATPPAPPVPASQGRVAAAPDAASRVVYGVRVAAPAVVARAAPAERIAQAPIDGAAAGAAQRRRTRSTALIVVVAASVVAVAAAASLLAITLMP